MMIKSIFKIKLLLVAVMAITFSETTICMDQESAIKATYTVAKPLSKFFTNQINLANKSYRNILLLSSIGVIGFCICSAILAACITAKIYSKKFSDKFNQFAEETVSKRGLLVERLFSKKNIKKLSSTDENDLAEKNGAIIVLASQVKIFRKEIKKINNNFKIVKGKFERLEEKSKSNGGDHIEIESIEAV